MSAPVDVLAVMDREIEEARERVPFMHPEGPQNAEHQREYEEAGDVLVQLREARAAVAELIEAAERARKCERFDSDVDSWVAYSLRFRESRDRLSSALARVKGA